MAVNEWAVDKDKKENTVVQDWGLKTSHTSCCVEIDNIKSLGIKLVKLLVFWIFKKTGTMSVWNNMMKKCYNIRAVLALFDEMACIEV